VQLLPPKSTLRVMTRVRLCVPVPQLLSQSLQEPKEVIMQSTGQWFVLQLWLAELTVPHKVPPFLAATTMLRARCDRPPPQVCEHTDHCDHPDQTQLTGQGTRLHVRSSSSEGQATPPYATLTSTDRTRFCTPSAPHE
jgi:hypothetical protein